MNFGLSLWCSIGALSLACGKAPEASPAALRAALPRGVVARVGDQEISLSTVQRIARGAGVSLREARTRALSDALFAVAAKASSQERALIPVLQRAVLARVLLEGMKRDALARGPASDAEVEALSALRWRELDRPEAVRVSHVVALFDKSVDEGRVRALAQRLHDALSKLTDAQQFVSRAQAEPHAGAELRAERLPAISADGRAFDPDHPSADIGTPTFDLDFAKAANSLVAGQVSEPIKTRFGYHVILCEARIPEQRVPLEQRRQILGDEVVKGRAERAKEELLSRLSERATIPISRAADDLMARVPVSE
jgi:hypothetical protein